MIPRIIHQLWINPANNSAEGMPDDVSTQCARWLSLNPHFLYKLWCLSDILTICRLTSRARYADAINASRFPAMKADISRLVLLSEFGGFWCDLKLSPIKPIPDSLINYDNIVTEHFPKANLPVPNGFLINSFIGSKPNSKLIQCALDLSTTNIDKRVQGSVFEISGPPNLMKAQARTAESGELTHLLAHSDAYDNLFGHGYSSYNNDGKHWSQRQDYEPIYVDG